MKQMRSRPRAFFRLTLVSSLFLFSCFWLVKNYTQWQNFSATLLYPLFVIQSSVTSSVNNFFEQRKTVKQLHSELSFSQQQREKLQAELIEKESLESYYQDIKEIVDFKKRYSSEKKEIAQIIVKQFTPETHFFLLDAGKKRGVQKDMIAVSYDKLVGKVTEVFDAYCKVVLITDPLCKVAVKIARTGMRGIHEGKLSLTSTHIMYMDHLAALEVGDLVISSGEGLIFPQGFALGTIETCAIKGLQYHVTVRPLVDLETLNYCTIIQKGSELQ